MIKRLLIPLCLFLLLAGCMPSAAPVDAYLENPTLTETNLRRDSMVQAKGKVVLARQVNLSFPMAGIITSLVPQEGDMVHAGESIAQLDTTQIKAEILRAEADLAIAQARQRQVLAGPHEKVIEQARLQVTVERSVRSIGYVEETAVAANVKIAQAQLDNLLAQPYPEDVQYAQAEVDRATRIVDQAKARLAQAELIMPYTGTVTRVFLYPGEYASMGQSVLEITDLNDIKVEAVVSDQDLTSLSLGQEAKVTFDTLPGVTLKGKLVNVVPLEGGEWVGQFTVSIKLEKIPVGVRWGLPANVSFTTSQ